MATSMKELDVNIFEQIAGQTDEVWFLFDLTFKKFTYLGPTFKALWKRKPESILENPASILETIHPEDQQYVKNNYEEFLRKKQRVRLDFRILHPNKKHRWIALKTYPIEQHGEVSLVAGFAEDDTPRKENLLHLQTVNGRKNASLEIISHDMRAPLGLIQWLSNIIDRELTSFPELPTEQLMHYTNSIREVCQRNIDLIRAITKEEYLSSPEVEIDKERLELVGETKAVLETYQLVQDNIKKVFQLTSSHPTIYAEVDSGKYTAIINNLVSNAVKFTPEMGYIHIHLEEKEKLILITVKDNGIGIPSKHHDILFDKFTKARRPGLKGEESVGLGMSIIKRLVELHNGKIYLESEENKGTTFFIEIPKKPISTSKL
ncbi:MAG: PAS domain-containing sensor histidine kinase [Bacteroidota bacterium]|nr:PAS domain-containing sensor histidine kinase [Bacteroidota bacterium]